MQTLFKTLAIAVTLAVGSLAIGGSASAGPDANYSPLYPDHFRSDSQGR
jgi:hypothetical protein